jgi:TonB family protein
MGHTAGGGGGGAGTERAVAGPTGKVDVGSTTATVAVANAGAVVAGLRAGFRSCYNSGLNVDPTMSGRVMLSVKISPNGEVSGVDPSGNTGLSDQVVQCLVRKVRNAQFDAPGPTGSTLQIPITFVQQAK